MNRERPHHQDCIEFRALAFLIQPEAGSKVGAREQLLPRCLEPAHLGKERLGLTIHILTRDTPTTNNSLYQRPSTWPLPPTRTRNCGGLRLAYSPMTDVALTNFHHHQPRESKVTG